MSRSFVAFPDDGRACRPETLQHSREAPPVTDERPRGPTAAELAAADLDVLVVGGGMVGAGVALDAVTRGLRVGLVDAGDWGGGQVRADQHPGPRRAGRPGSDRGARRRRTAPGARSAAGPHRAAPRSTGAPAGPAHRRSCANGSAGVPGLSVYDAAAFSIRQPGSAARASAAASARRAAAGPVGGDDAGDRSRPAVRGPGRRRPVGHRRRADGDRVRGRGGPAHAGPTAADRTLRRCGQRDASPTTADPGRSRRTARTTERSGNGSRGGSGW